MHKESVADQSVCRATNHLWQLVGTKPLKEEAQVSKSVLLFFVPFQILR